ncbi:MAG: SGNH/GDSL hydrolase family protein [Anaeromyxobacter sp.]
MIGAPRALPGLLSLALLAAAPPLAGCADGQGPATRSASAAAASTAVTWSVAEAGGGSVSATGLYSAPAAEGLYHVRATSVADAAVRGEAAVTVKAAGTGGPTPMALLAHADPYDGAPSGGAKALDLGAARGQVLLFWKNDGNGGESHDAAIRGWLPGVPAAYVVETAAAAAGPWTARVTVSTSPRTGTSQNTLTSRQHLFSAAGDRWLRVRVTSGDTNLGRVDVLDATNGAADSFVIFGDSITQFSAEASPSTSIADRVAALTGGAHHPVVEGAGITYDKYDGDVPSGNDTDARQRLLDYLPLHPGKYVGLAYGTNDSVNDATEVAAFKAAFRTCLDRILAAGKTPMVATVPWNAEQTTIVARNQHLAAVLAEPAYAGKWIAGPDLYAFFSQAANQHFITDGDGLHPSVAGEGEWRRLWAEAIVANAYK